MTTNGASAKNREELLRAVTNAVNHAKRSLLDFADFQRSQIEEDESLEAIRPRLIALLEFWKRRIHNDVSIIKDQVYAALEIYESGGVIPPFGRSQEALDTLGPGQRARRR